MRKVLDNLKYIKTYDIYSVFCFCVMLPLAIIFKIYNKIKKKKLWLICEDGKHARDNGFYLYKFIKEQYPKENCFYVIDKKSKDYNKVKQYNSVIQFRSPRHWIYYLAADYNISSQKNGNPAQVLFYVLHVVLGFMNNRVFLQHGIIKDKCEWLFYKNTKFKYFVCGAKKEYEYVIKEYGYPEDSVKYLGLARYDTLKKGTELSKKNKQILIMPTWRNWLGRETNFLGKKFDFLNTDFFKNWTDLLNSTKFCEFIEKNNIKVLFYPHMNMERFLEHFEFNSRNIIKCNTEINIQDVLNNSSIMITDFSSVFMDFAYSEKPIIYYQFDKEEYRKKQYVEGYFNYERDGFGPVCYKCEDVIKYIEFSYKREFQIEEKYLKKCKDFFERHDNKNCERHIRLLKNEEE